MSFSIDWLNLREPADSRSRNRGLIHGLADWCAGRDARVLDLGSGTGSSYRGLAPHIGGRWTLSDIDAGLLAEARNRHSHDSAFTDTAIVDLQQDLEQLLAEHKPDVVTGSALIDLASASWLDRLVAALPASCAFYMALSYDGFEQWTPTPLHEGAAQRAFLDHQRTDKGFGAALGPDATSHIAARLRAGGWSVETADSPWILEHEDTALIHALAEGSASAVADTGALDGAALSEWVKDRKAATHVTVGHTDILALPV